MPKSLDDSTSAIAAEWQAAWNAHDMSHMAARHFGMKMHTGVDARSLG